MCRFFNFKNVLLILSIIILFSGCTTGVAISAKNSDLKDGRIKYEENEIIFYYDTMGWIFKRPSMQPNGDVRFSIVLATDEKINDVILSSYKIANDKLNYIYEENNLEIDLTDNVTYKNRDVRNLEGDSYYGNVKITLKHFIPKKLVTSHWGLNKLRNTIYKISLTINYKINDIDKETILLGEFVPNVVNSNIIIDMFQ